LKKLRTKNILEWLLNKDIKQYYKNGIISDEVPEEVKLAIEHLKDVIAIQYSLELTKKQMEYSALRSQINPHFLYNTLEAVRSQAILAGVPDIAAMTERLSCFFRYCISSKGDFVTIREELNNVRDYFYIQQYRFEDRFSLKIINEEDNHDILDCFIPKMTLQPLVENSIFHGLEPRNTKGTVIIRMRSTKQKIYIYISDDGVGISPEKINQCFNTDNEHNGHIGMNNVNARIHLYFGSPYGLHVQSIPDIGTDVEVMIPYVDEVNRKKYSLEE